LAGEIRFKFELEGGEQGWVVDLRRNACQDESGEGPGCEEVMVVGQISQPERQQRRGHCGECGQDRRGKNAGL
jgi:hypothetical protein